MGMLQIDNMDIREESITYIEHVSKFREDWSQEDPDDLYKDRLPKIEYKVARIHFVGGGPPLEISSEMGMTIIDEYLKVNRGKTLA